MSATQTTIDHERFYIGGEWVEPAEPGRPRFEVTNASTEEILGSVPAGTAADVDRAVRAAQAAFDGWSQVPVHERAALCVSIGDVLAARAEEIGVLIAAELGMPVQQSVMIQAALPAISFRSIPQLVEQVDWVEEIGNSTVYQEPVGVVGAITPWNYPLHQIAAKVAPALAAGCTVVLKPSEVTPLNAFVLAAVMDECGLPPGVFNLVTGDGPTVGEAISGHAGIDMVSFTGSTAAGRRVSENASRTVKKVALELGGKSPNVLLDDAPLERAVVDGLKKCFINSGQTCSGLTRMLVPRAHLPVVEQIVQAVVPQFALGEAFEEGAALGPLVSAAQRDRVVGYIRRGIAEGARVVVGGPEAPEGRERGYFVRPTVFSDVTPDMTIAREEIFGPVLVLMPYDDEDDAVRIANDTDYGLDGGVWSGDEERALRVARRIRTGRVEINGGVFNPLAPFGGFKQSGHGRELGRYGLEEFLVPKALQR